MRTAVVLLFATLAYSVAIDSPRPYGEIVAVTADKRHHRRTRGGPKCTAGARGGLDGWTGMLGKGPKAGSGPSSASALGAAGSGAMGDMSDMLDKLASKQRQQASTNAAC